MKMNPSEIYNEATQRGLRFIPRGSLLEVTPKSRLTPELFAVIRANKMELLAELEAKRCHGLTHLILDGEFDVCDAATRRKLLNELRSVPHPQARSAIARLESEASK
jgi:hypothetical protein